MDFDFEKFYFMLLDILIFSENIMFQFVWISLRIYLQNEATPEPRPATNWNGAGKTKAKGINLPTQQIPWYMTPHWGFRFLSLASSLDLCSLKLGSFSK